MANKIFDFGGQNITSGEKKKEAYVTYKTFDSDSNVADREHPFFYLDEPHDGFSERIYGKFENPHTRTSFIYNLTDKKQADIVLADKRFVGLLNYLGSKNEMISLKGVSTGKGYAVYRIHAVDSTGEKKLAGPDSFLALVIDRLLSSQIYDEEDEPDDIKIQDKILMSDMHSLTDFVNCAGMAFPPNIRNWAFRNITLASSATVSTDEKRHAARALSMMLNIKWKDAYFGSIDPIQAKKILDEELFGLEKVKQRIIETIIQINRTHTLPAYGLLLAGPAGIGKSQIAYAVAKILKLPWTSLDMSAIRDAEQLTGSPRVYANAKPGKIMEAFSQAGTSNLVFIINELDKADSGSNSGNPADALLTLLDNLGYTDNYIECTIPTTGVYPVATANDKSKIGEPLLTRFAIIDIPDYSLEEKKEIFLRFALPRVFERMHLNKDECIVTEEAADVVIMKYKDSPGCRDLEQAAEHMAANALYQIEMNGVKSVTFDRESTRKLLE